MAKYRIAIVGFGVVGRGIGSILHEKKDFLKSRYDFDFDVVGISDLIWGTVYNPDGIDLGKALDLVSKKEKLDPLGEVLPDSLTMIRETDYDILLEITPTNMETGDPGYTHIREALKRGKHVATTNKGPIALHYRELSELAAQKGAELRFEGTVLSGTPTINMALKDLAGCEFSEIRGILNGTTNFILTEMEKGKSYEEALKEAQRLGYAEAKPDADVEGWDAMAKIIILANVVMGGDVSKDDVSRTGITGLTIEDVENARKTGKKWKLVGRAWREGGKVRAAVAPMEVGPDDFLYHVQGVLNAVVFSTDIIGDVTVVGRGAGSKEAGYALLTDVLDIHRKLTGR
ncbi:MAG: homoserine dehydrogenase [Candidatus Hydrothermae bacterium]|nr:homoserine dehydrogenase [Candidatus Hydrothermae bacterium]